MDEIDSMDEIDAIDEIDAMDETDAIDEIYATDELDAIKVNTYQLRLELVTAGTDLYGWLGHCRILTIKQSKSKAVFFSLELGFG